VGWIQGASRKITLIHRRAKGRQKREGLAEKMRRGRGEEKM